MHDAHPAQKRLIGCTIDWLVCVVEFVDATARGGPVRVVRAIEQLGLATAALHAARTQAEAFGIVEPLPRCEAVDDGGRCIHPAGHDGCLLHFDGVHRWPADPPAT